jgi:hypothetical protein
MMPARTAASRIDTGQRKKETLDQRYDELLKAKTLIRQIAATIQA